MAQVYQHPQQVYPPQQGYPTQQYPPHNVPMQFDMNRGDVGALSMLQTSDVGPMEFILRNSLAEGVVVRMLEKGGCMCVPGAREYYFSNGQPQAPEIMKATENSWCCARWCCLNNRCFDIELNMGATGEGPLVAKFSRPLCGAMAPCKCCCLQRMWAYDAKGNELGGAREVCCWQATPQLELLKADGSSEYVMRQSTCCCNMFKNRCALGVGKCLSCWEPPVSFWSGEFLKGGEEKGRITHLVGAVEARLTGQMMLQYDTKAYQIKIPKGTDGPGIARFLAGFFLSMEVMMNV